MQDIKKRLVFLYILCYTEYDFLLYYNTFLRKSKGCDKNMLLPKNVVYVINTLNKAGYEAFVVGGAVRDYIMGLEPHDYDITTSAFPDEVKSLFPNYFPLGEKFGTVSVIVGDEQIEVTTFRSESDYEDGRHPNKVEFVRSLEKDLKRRDFTMNAIAYNPNTGFIDPFNGISDIKEKIIRCVNDANERFKEDGLRIVRAVRFSAKFGFSIEQNTLIAAKNNIDMLDKVSKERIGSEFAKILMSDNCEEAINNNDFLFDKIIPQWKDVRNCQQNSEWHIYDVKLHTLKVLSSIKNTERLRLAAFFHDFGKPYVKEIDENGISHFPGHADKSSEIAEKVLKDLRFSSKEIKEISLLIKYHDSFWNPSKKLAKRLLNILGDELFLDLIELRRADISAQKERPDNSVSEMLMFYDIIKKDNSAISIKDLKINGLDVMKTLQIEPSPKVGEILSSLLSMVIDEEIENEREILLEKTKEIQKELG